MIGDLISIFKGSGGQLVIKILLIVVVMICIFFVIRELIIWHYRINSIVAMMRNIASKTNEIAGSRVSNKGNTLVQPKTHDRASNYDIYDKDIAYDEEEDLKEDNDMQEDDNIYIHNISVVEGIKKLFSRKY